jgi:hypothetical protein
VGLAEIAFQTYSFSVRILVSMNFGVVAHRGVAVAPGSESGGHSAGTQRFEEPLPPDSSLMRWIQEATGVFNARVAGVVDADSCE